MCNVSASFQLTFIAPIWKEAQREPGEVLLHYNLKNAAEGLVRHIILLERPLRLKCSEKDAFRENYFHSPPEICGGFCKASQKKKVTVTLLKTKKND